MLILELIVPLYPVPSVGVERYVDAMLSNAEGAQLGDGCHQRATSGTSVQPQKYGGFRRRYLAFQKPIGREK